MKKGFTLGEALTTLMIIGIIAAMTMPILYNNVGKQRNQTLLRKIYASYVINIGQVLHLDGQTCDSLSCLRNWGKTGKDASGNGVAVDIYGNSIANTNKHNGTLANKNTFNVDADCANCVPNDSDIPDLMNGKTFSGYILRNGAYVAIYDYDGNCTTKIGTDEDDEDDFDFKACSVMVIDVNGAKGPNKHCVDRFAFYVADSPLVGNANFKPSYLVPLGYDKVAPDFTDEAEPYSCTAKIVYNNLKIE